jgi:hypothetical protein
MNLPLRGDKIGLDCRNHRHSGPLSWRPLTISETVLQTGPAIIDTLRELCGCAGQAGGSATLQVLENSADDSRLLAAGDDLDLPCPLQCSQLWDFDAKTRLSRGDQLIDRYVPRHRPPLTRGFESTAVALAQAPGRRCQIKISQKLRVPADPIQNCRRT